MESTWPKRVNQHDKEKKTNNTDNIVLLNKYQNWSGKRDKKNPGRGGHRSRRRGINSVRGYSGRRNFDGRNNQNKRQEMKFYPHEPGLDQQTATFTEVKEHILLRIQNEFWMEVIFHNQSETGFIYL